MSHRRNVSRVVICIVLLLSIATLVSAQGKKALTLQDIMQFREIHDAQISEDGKWVVYTASPDRGDGEVLIEATDKSKQYRIPRGSSPVISRNGAWVAATVLPEAQELLQKNKEKPKNGMALVNTASGEIFQFENVQTFRFSENSQWLVYKHFPSRKMKGKNKKSTPSGDTLIVRNLSTGRETVFSNVMSFAFDSLSTVLVLAKADTSGKKNGLYFVEMSQSPLTEQLILSRENGCFTTLSWNNKKGKLAFLAGTYGENGEPQSLKLMLWDRKARKVREAVAPSQLPDGWLIYHKNALIWSRDGERLFFGLKPKSEIIPENDDEKRQKSDLYDIQAILSERGVDVWHWNDPLINPNQKKMWNRIKDRTYRAVYHLKGKKFVPLADPDMPDIRIPNNARFALGISNVPYLKLITWFGRLYDYYLVDLKSGKRQKILEKMSRSVTLSPQGKYVVYYRDKHWFLRDTRSGSVRNLTANLATPFYNEDHDYPSPIPGYGIAGWMENDNGVLIYDKYDIWLFPTKSGAPKRLTKGREQHLTFRLIQTQPDRNWLRSGEPILLSAYHQLKKFTVFYHGRAGEVGVTPLVQAEKKFTFVAKAKKADKILFTREDYDEFPDLWVADGQFRSPLKLSDVNPQMKEFAWGSAELVEWRSADNIPLQGVLIKPGNYKPGKRYPVLVYFYRFMSQRLHEFNQVVINHRPCFPYYASNGYAIFLPDIRFEVGRPGFSATKCLVPGVQKIIDMGVADPNAIALHGHSWSGYQTAFVVTQTNLFKCAIAGAPVSNMTSAYGGIRWGTGLARQFQYEQTQSRIGGSLWDCRDRYIENSPLFYADHIETPLLIMHGDKDDAVPWYQSIELYLAMRRLGKECIFLQYRNEPHHPRNYANKLDYTIKMKEFLDHYLKGAPAPEWLAKGVPYKGK